MKRSLARSGRMKRTQLRKVSKRQRVKLADWAKVTLARMVRVGNKCERCHVAKAEQGHHVLPRSRGGENTDENCRVVCAWCHNEIHNFPSHSYATGWLKRNN